VPVADRTKKVFEAALFVSIQDVDYVSITKLFCVVMHRFL
jgi:hypothetical protein